MAYDSDSKSFWGCIIKLPREGQVIAVCFWSNFDVSFSVSVQILMSGVEKLISVFGNSPVPSKLLLAVIGKPINKDKGFDWVIINSDIVQTSEVKDCWVRLMHWGLAFDPNETGINSIILSDYFLSINFDDYKLSFAVHNK